MTYSKVMEPMHMDYWCYGWTSINRRHDSQALPIVIYDHIFHFLVGVGYVTYSFNITDKI